VRSVHERVHLLLFQEVSRKRLHILQLLSEEFLRPRMVYLELLYVISTHLLSCKRGDEVFVIPLDVFLRGPYGLFVGLLSRFPSKCINDRIDGHERVVGIVPVCRVYLLNLAVIPIEPFVRSGYFLRGIRLLFLFGCLRIDGIFYKDFVNLGEYLFDIAYAAQLLAVHDRVQHEHDMVLMPLEVCLVFTSSIASSEPGFLQQGIEDVDGVGIFDGIILDAVHLLDHLVQM